MNLSFARLSISLLVLLMLSGCAAPYAVKPVTNQKYPATQSVELVFEKPDKPFTVIASFSGTRQNSCAKSEPYCDLRKQAREQGAHAVWVQHSESQQYPGDWVEYRGRMIRIYPYTRVSVSGVFIRFP